MNDKLAREILITHADMLSNGDDTTELLSRRYPELSILLHLARQVHDSLEVVPASAEFVDYLYRELMLTPQHNAKLQGSSMPQRQVAVNTGWLVGGVALGSALTGVAVWAVRRMGAVEQDVSVATR